MFHFSFHSTLDLPEALTAGREDLYLQHFYDKLGYRPSAVDAAHYGDTREGISRDGRLTVPVLGLHGQISDFSSVTESMALEIAEDVRVREVAGAGHWMAEENPKPPSD